MRLSDIYYTNITLDGNPEPPAIQAPVEFYQGEDITLDVFLSYNGQPITEDNWEIVGTLKKNKYAVTTLWEAKLDQGLYKLEKPGFWRFLLPSESSATFLPGTYWLTVMIHEKLGDGPKDLDVVILNQPFSINLSAASPHPNLDNRQTERTYPPAVDVSQA